MTPQRRRHLAGLPFIGGSFQNKEPPRWEDAQAAALGSGICSTAGRFQGELAERQPVVKISPLPGWTTCVHVSYKAVVCFRGGGGFAVAGRGRARHS